MYSLSTKNFDPEIFFAVTAADLNRIKSNFTNSEDIISDNTTWFCTNKSQHYQGGKILLTFFETYGFWQG